MKKICMLTTSDIFHDSRILNEAKTLSSKYKLVILAKKYPGQRGNKLSFKIKLVSYLKLPWFQLNIFSSFYSLMKAAFKENPDIYHAHDLDGLLCAIPAALLKRKLLIYDTHELWSELYPFSNLGALRWFLKPLEKLLMFKVKAGITVNNSITKYLYNKYHKLFVACYNFPVKMKIIKAKLSLKKMFPNKKIILHLGFIGEGRGLEQIIQAFTMLPSTCIIVFLGHGGLEKRIQKMSQELGIEKQVIILPSVPPEAVVPTAKEADLGLALIQNKSLSYYYSSPNKLFQYIAAGVPVLGSNFPEIKKIILGNKIGEVVDPSKPKLISQKIQKMIKNLQKYQKNYAKINKYKYTWENEGQKLIEFYQKIISEKKTSISRRFKIDVLANILSLAFLGISGIIINILVARHYGAQALGLFNEVYAIYILASQFAVGSIHLSVQKYLAAEKSQIQINKIISSGLFLTLVYGLIVSLVIYFSRHLWFYWFKSPEVSQAVIYIAFGLIGFAINKTLMAILNGFRKMKAFAFFQALRYFLIVLFLIYASLKNFPEVVLPAAFSFAEVILFLILIVYVSKYFRFISPKSWGGWLSRHFVFGFRSLLGNVLVDVNTRVDILILGFFLSERLVGIYSFAAIIAEGFSQLLVVLKTNINPILSRLASEKNYSELYKVVLRGRNLTYTYFAILTAIGLGLYPIALRIFVPGGIFRESFFIFAVLMIGLGLSSGYQPFQMLLAQAGFPTYYSLLILIVFIANVLLNFLLVPIWGIYGSAIATGLSFIIAALLLRFLTKKALKFKI